jgi:hypothetical protein
MHVTEKELLNSLENYLMYTKTQSGEDAKALREIVDPLKRHFLKRCRAVVGLVYVSNASDDSLVMNTETGIACPYCYEVVRLPRNTR